MIAGAGFAMMAWKLAQNRGGRLYQGSYPRKRHELFLQASDREYYCILDRAWHCFNLQMQVGEYGKHYAYMPVVSL